MEEAFVDKALSFIGCHYIWGGKGQSIYTPQGLQLHKFTDNDNPPKALMVFDCSGLVTTCLWLVTSGLLNLRGTHGAKTMLDTFPIAKSEEDGVLRIYPGHVSISLGRGRVVEAAGGDESTTSIQAALNRSACVRAGQDLRRAETLLGLRRVPLDKSELRAV